MARVTAQTGLRGIVLLGVAGCNTMVGGAAPPAYGPADQPFVPTVAVALRAGPAASGTERVNFALPLPAGALSDDRRVRVVAGGQAVPVASRGLAQFPDGSFRALQVQVDVDPTAVASLQIEIGAPAEATLERVPVELTLTEERVPRVWVELPSWFIVQSGVMGPALPLSLYAGTELDAWGEICDYERWATPAFLERANEREVWLFDRVTANYRGYAQTGSSAAQESAYREAEIYCDGASVDDDGVASGIAVPGANDDLKYHYAQGLAIHYLMTGDDRFRDAAQAIALRAATLWTDPGYEGGDDFWTERHAGFGLLAYDWAARVSDAPAEFAQLADNAVDAYLAAQEAYDAPDNEARCFAHTGLAHGESWEYLGCSPWMSAILADALDGYARRVGGPRADVVATSLVKLGRSIARDGRDADGRPYYFMGIEDGNEEDGGDEHWGEAAYVTALAWHLSGRTDAELRSATDEFVAGLRAYGSAPHIRSFNWQCRSAVLAPAFLAE